MWKTLIIEPTINKEKKFTAILIVQNLRSFHKKFYWLIDWLIDFFEKSLNLVDLSTFL